jgi:hypothetical protein
VASVVGRAPRVGDRAVSRFASHFMSRTIDWMDTQVAPRTPYARDLVPWRAR